MIGKLADRSARSAHDISELIQSIQRESRAAVQQMDQSDQIVKEYISDSSVSDALSVILSSIEQIVAATREIEPVTQEQSGAAEQAAMASEYLSRLTHEIGAATEEQSVGAAEVARAMDQLRELARQSLQMTSDLEAAAESLNQQSGTLNLVVNGFNTSGQPSPAASRPGVERPGIAGKILARGLNSFPTQQTLATDRVN